MKNIDFVEFANKLNAISSRRYFDVSDLLKGSLTPLHQMVSDVRKFYIEYHFEAPTKAYLRLNDKYTLSLAAGVSSADEEDFLEEGAAQLEIAVVKNGRVLIEDDYFIHIRYDKFLWILRELDRTGDKRVSYLLYALKKSEELEFVDGITAAERAKAFVSYVMDCKG